MLYFLLITITMICYMISISHTYMCVYVNVFYNNILSGGSRTLGQGYKILNFHKSLYSCV